LYLILFDLVSDACIVSECQESKEIIRHVVLIADCNGSNLECGVGC